MPRPRLQTQQPPRRMQTEKHQHQRLKNMRVRQHETRRERIRRRLQSTKRSKRGKPIMTEPFSLEKPSLKTETNAIHTTHNNLTESQSATEKAVPTGNLPLSPVSPKVATDEGKQKTPIFINPIMKQFCRNDCILKKPNCQHSCSLVVYEIKHRIGGRKKEVVTQVCPKCNDIKIHSRGKTWFCESCGKYWTKNYCPKKIYPSKPNFCFECGSNHIKSAGKIWICNDCGKSWIKQEFKRSFSVFDFPELTNPTVVREVKTF